MNISGIEVILRAALVPNGDYSLGQPVENTFVLCKERDVWKTFMFEKGQRDFERSYQTEDEACRRFVVELILSRIGHD